MRSETHLPLQTTSLESRGMAPNGRRAPVQRVELALFTGLCLNRVVPSRGPSRKLREKRIAEGRGLTVPAPLSQHLGVVVDPKTTLLCRGYSLVQVAP